ncbi:MAG TPA: hypothetical protein VEF89_27730 [Solirubrobacteraceae bacterium]|nr:hypothetical protein [Solirubrobacteraceae bacterium]
MPQQRTVTPGYTVVFPNREKAGSKAMKAVVAFILLVSVALILIVTIGGWSQLEGMKPLNFFFAIAYLVVAFYVFVRWSRGMLPIAAGLAILLLMIALVAGLGLSGTSWFDRSHAGFAPAQSLFGGDGLSADTLGLVTVLIVPVQVLVILFALSAFAQGWNVEQEVPIEEARERGYNPPEPPRSGAPTTA